MARTAKPKPDKADPVSGPQLGPESGPESGPELGPDTVTASDAPDSAAPESGGADFVADVTLSSEPVAIAAPVSAGQNNSEAARQVKPAPKRSAVPLVIAGVVAAALGYAAAYWGQQSQSATLATLLAAQSDKITALSDQLAALPAPPDLAPLDTAIADLTTSLSLAQAESSSAFAALDARLVAVEKAPNADGTLSDAAIAAWERDVAALRFEVEAQQARMQEIAAAAAAQLDQTRVEVATIEQTATDASAAANARAALARVQAALDSGAPFDAALADLARSVPPPAQLAAIASTGVPTMLSLQTDFPNAARAALATARAEGLSGEDGGGFAVFLRNQFDVRAVTPQEGATVDAILSRAEDDLRQNRLIDALSEVAALPEVVRAEMAGWTGAAEARIAAIAAVEGLSQSLSSN